MNSSMRQKDLCSLVLGVYVMCLPLFTLDSSDDSTLWSAELIGAAIITAALWALAQPHSAAAEWSQIVIGLVFVAAPFLFAYDDIHGPAANAYAVGLAVMIIGAWALSDVSRLSGSAEDEALRHKRIGMRQNSI